MVDTRGFQTINDRTDGWGHNVDEDLQPDADAAKQTTSDRVAKLKKERKVANVGVNPDTHDRSEGIGGVFDPTRGSVNGYLDASDDEDLDIGEDFEIEVTGSDTARTVDDPEVSSFKRPAEAWDYEASTEDYTDDQVEWGTGFSEQGEVTHVASTPALGSKNERGDASVALPS